MLNFDPDRLKQLIATGKTEEAINELLAFLKTKNKYKEVLNNLINYSSRLYRVKKAFDIQTISIEDYQMECNRVEFSIMALIDDLHLNIIEKPIIDKAEIANRKKDKELKRLTESVTLAEVGVWEWTKTREYHSSSWKAMLGYKDQELILDATSTWEGLLHPDDKDKAIEHFNLFLNRKTPTYDTLFRLLCNDGQYKWIRSKANISKRSEEGTIKRIVGVHLDWSYVMNEIQKQKALVATVSEQKKEIDSLRNERSEIVDNLKNARPLQKNIFEKIQASVDSLDSATIEKISPLINNIYEMEHIISISNDAMIPESRTLSYIEKDFHLKNTLENVAIRLRKMFKVDSNRQLLPIDDTLVSHFILKGYFEQLRGLIYWLVKFVYRNTTNSDLLLKVEELPLQHYQTDSATTTIKTLLKFYVLTDTHDKVPDEKLIDLETYFYNSNSKKNEFIESELTFGLQQIINIIKLIDAKLEITKNAENKINGISIYIPFTI